MNLSNEVNNITVSFLKCEVMCQYNDLFEVLYNV